MYGQICGNMFAASKRKEKPHLDNTRRLRGVFFIEFDMKEIKRIMKNRRRKLEIPMPPAVF